MISSLLIPPAPPPEEACVRRIAAKRPVVAVWSLVIVAFSWRPKTSGPAKGRFSMYLFNRLI